MSYPHFKLDADVAFCYICNMETLMKKVRKFFWVEPAHAKLVEAEAKKLKISESALMRHIISNWFKK